MLEAGKAREKSSRFNKRPATHLGWDGQAIAIGKESFVMGHRWQ
jgi:hypothetical protein